MVITHFEISRAFDIAREFDDSSRDLFPLRAPYYRTVCMVNSAFACEIYLKCLVKFYGEEPKDGHDLSWLFKRLPKEEKVTLEHMHSLGDFEEAQYQMIFSNETGHMTLKELFKMCRDRTYQRMRYEYQYVNGTDNEPPSIIHYRLLFSANAVLRKRIHALLPELHPMHRNDIDPRGVMFITKT